MTDNSDLLTVELGQWTVMQDPNVDSFVTVSHEDRSGHATLSKELDDRDALCFDSDLINAISEFKERENNTGKQALAFEDNDGDRKLFWPDGNWHIYHEDSSEESFQFGDHILVCDDSHMVNEDRYLGNTAGQFLDDPEHSGKWAFESVEVVEVTEEMVSA